MKSQFADAILAQIKNLVKTKTLYRAFELLLNPCCPISIVSASAVCVGAGVYTVTVTTDKRTDGSPCETIVVQAVQPLEFTNETILNQAIYDVAINADHIEKTYFGGDAN